MLRGKKDPQAWKDWRQKKRVTEDEMVGRMASPVLWTWTWMNSGRWWGTGESSMLKSTGSQSRTQLGDWKTTRFWHIFSSSTTWILLLPSLPSLLSSRQVTFHISSAYRHVTTVAHAVSTGLGCLCRLPVCRPTDLLDLDQGTAASPVGYFCSTSADTLRFWRWWVSAGEVENIALSMSCGFAPSLSKFWFPASSVPRT